MKVLRVEATPNPNAFKFILDGSLVSSGSKQFDAAPSPEEDALAAEIFGIPGVVSVFYMDDFISVTAQDPRFAWGELKEKLQTLVADQAAAVRSAAGEVGKIAKEEVSAAAGAVAGAVSQSADKASAEMLIKIDHLLDEYVRPALAGDGGGLEVLGLDGEDLIIRYQGACGTCPSAISGTLFAIQNMIRQELDTEINVIPG